MELIMKFLNISRDQHKVFKYSLNSLFFLLLHIFTLT